MFLISAAGGGPRRRAPRGLVKPPINKSQGVLVLSTAPDPPYVCVCNIILSFLYDERGSQIALLIHSITI